MLKPQLTVVTEWLRRPKTGYSNGKFVAPERGELRTSVNPATGLAVGQYFESTLEEVDRPPAPRRKRFAPDRGPAGRGGRDGPRWKRSGN